LAWLLSTKRSARCNILDLVKVADVLEKVAAYIDATEAEKQDNINNSRSKIASLLQENYEDATGEILDDDVVSKIASADVDILTAIDRLTQRDDSELGSASSIKSASAPVTKKEQAEAAEDHFAEFCLNS